MAKILYEDGKKIGEVEDWQQTDSAPVYKTFLGKTVLVSPSNIECSFTSPKPVKKRNTVLTIIEDGKTKLLLTVTKVTGGTQVEAKIRIEPTDE